MTTMASTRPRIEAYSAMPWADMRALLHHGPKDAGRWEQGDHLFISAPTKAGKTTLAAAILNLRSRVVVFVSKLKDETFRREFKGWTILREWPKNGPEPWQTHILLWPEAVKNDLDATTAVQRAVFRDALNRISTTGHWCVVIDETLMFTDPKYIGLGKQVGQLHYFGRSSGITMVTLSQRPAWIPKVIMSSVTHAFIARIMDADDAKRLGDLGGNINRREVVEQLGKLPTRHDYLYLNPQGDAAPVVVNTRK